MEQRVIERLVYLVQHGPTIDEVLSFIDGLPAADRFLVKMALKLRVERDSLGRHLVCDLQPYPWQEAFPHSLTEMTPDWQERAGLKPDGGADAPVSSGPRPVRQDLFTLATEMAEREFRAKCN